MHEVPRVGDNKVDEIKRYVQTRGPQLSVKQQMLRFLRRSKSMVRPPPPPPADRRNNRNSDSQKVHVTRNGMVVTIVDGLPCVVGTKVKKLLVFLRFAYELQGEMGIAQSLIHRYYSYKRFGSCVILTDITNHERQILIEEKEVIYQVPNLESSSNTSAAPNPNIDCPRCVKLAQLRAIQESLNQSANDSASSWEDLKSFSYARFDLDCLRSEETLVESLSSSDEFNNFLEYDGIAKNLYRAQNVDFQQGSILKFFYWVLEGSYLNINEAFKDF
ncbi:hypothetical protein FQR65_LT15653 [Abscondita terminalis]|nr:hypothetical protein FQR65_LT15653 [Abscondita terminalis]